MESLLGRRHTPSFFERLRARLEEEPEVEYAHCESCIYGAKPDTVILKCGSLAHDLGKFPTHLPLAAFLFITGTKETDVITRLEP